MLFSLIPTAAMAATVASGWNGHPLGDGKFLEEPPSAECGRYTNVFTVPGIMWRCFERVGTEEVQVSYSVIEGIFFSLRVDCTTEKACDALFRAARTMWSDTVFSQTGPGGPKYPSDPTVDWYSGCFGRLAYIEFKSDIFAEFNYNEYTNWGNITMNCRSCDIAVAQKIRLAEAAKNLP